MTWDYEAIDKWMQNELYRAGMWFAANMHGSRRFLHHFGGSRTTRKRFVACLEANLAQRLSYVSRSSLDG
jgi:hypothetical protein